MLTVETFDSIAAANGSMGGRSRYMGGGTLVMRSVNYGNGSFDRLVRSRDPALRRIRVDGATAVIGAGVTMSAIAASPELAFLAPVARVIGGPAIRNMATVGGNLFAPSPYGDLATALLALNARARFADGTDLDMEAFFARRESIRGLVESVSVTLPGRDEFRFKKVSRVKPKGVSVIAIAAWLPMRGGMVSNARIAFGSLGPAPLRAKAAESALERMPLDEQGIAGGLSVATEGLSPSDDALASGWYRKEIVPVHLKRLLLCDQGTD